MIKKILIILLGLLIIVMSKIIIYRRSLYIFSIPDEYPYNDFILTTKTKNFNLIDTLGWYIPGTNTKKIIIFCHGNSWNMTWKAPLFKRLVNTLKCPIICIDYLRTKKIKLSTLFARTDQLVKGLLDKGFDKSNIILFGESLGCSIVLNVASKYKIPNVICYIGFRSIQDVIKEKVPIIGKFVSLFVNELDNQSIILENNFNITLINSTEDDIINFSHIKQMSEVTGTELIEIKGKHTNVHIPDEVLFRLKEKYDL